MENVKGKRIFLKRKVPNPVFQECLENLLQEAKAKKSKLEPLLQEALTSLTQYPLPLQSGADCAILKGFNKKLCSFFDKYLDGYRSQNGDSTEPNNHIVTDLQSVKQSAQCSRICEVNQNLSFTSDAISRDINKTTKKSKDRKYKPVFRSGSYAILLGLLEYSKENNSNPLIGKNALIEKAQKYSEESFTRPKPESFYTAWSNMSTLVTKSLVKRTRSRTAQYSLTEEGILLATELLEEHRNKPTVNDIIFNGASSSSGSMVAMSSQNSQGSVSAALDGPTTADLQRTASTLKYVSLEANSFDVILLIDKQETGGVTKKNDPTVAQFNKYPDLKREYRSLKVGDYAWIARNKVKKDEELVLPYIVERKRMDDLGASIKDGRFHEQKFRLRKCGLKNVLYLAEKYGSNSHVGLPIHNLKQALANTSVQDGFKVHYTDSLTDSVRFLAMMTKRLTIEYKDKCLLGCNKESEGDELMTFDYFNKASVKNRPLTVTETFIKLLLQLRGVSVEKAVAITSAYKTPRLLIEAYQRYNRKEAGSLLANLKYGDSNRNVGPTISNAVYQLFTQL